MRPSENTQRALEVEAVVHCRISKAKDEENDGVWYNVKGLRYAREVGNEGADEQGNHEEDQNVVLVAVSAVRLSV
jgi:hypothetical protein